MNRYRLWLTVALWALAAAGRGDGCYIPSGERLDEMTRHPLQSPAQRAAVIRRADGREMLIVAPVYQGPAGGFAWVLPVPGLPPAADIMVAPKNALALLISDPQYSTTIHEPEPLRLRFPSFGMASAPRGVPAAAGAPGRPPVQVYSELNVGDYQAAVLGATGAGGLLAWLQGNGYQVPSAAGPVLQEYINKQWFFVALRLRADFADTGSGVRTLQSLMLSFPSERLVYPLTVTRVTAAPHLALQLAVVSRGPTKCTTLPTVDPPQELKLPPGSCYGSYRRTVAEQHPQGALLREGIASQSGPLGGYARSSATADQALNEAWKGPGYSTSFFALLPREALQDLYFDEEWTPAFSMTVEREATPPLPWWMERVSWGMLVALCGLLVLLALVTLHRAAARRRREEPAEGDLGTEFVRWLAPLGVFVLALSLIVPLVPYLVLPGACVVAIWLGIRQNLRLWARIPWAQRRLPLVGEVICGGLVALPLVVLLASEARAVALLLLNLAWVPLMAATVVPLVWLAAREGKREPTRWGGLIAGEVFLVLVLALGLGTGANLVRLSFYQSAGDESARQVQDAQRDLQDFTAAHGCYPLTVAQMEGWQTLAEGQTAGGDRVPLAASAAPAASPHSLVGVDPLTGRDDSWIIDPVDPQIITSKAFTLTIRSRQSGVGPVSEDLSAHKAVRGIVPSAEKKPSSSSDQVRASVRIDAPASWHFGEHFRAKAYGSYELSDYLRGLVRSGQARLTEHYEWDANPMDVSNPSTPHTQEVTWYFPPDVEEPKNERDARVGLWVTYLVAVQLPDGSYEWAHAEDHVVPKR